jgi:opacity protein-like surface antigen
MKHAWSIVPTGLVVLASSHSAFAGGTWTGTDEEFFEAATQFLETTDKYAHRAVSASYKKKVKAVGINYGVRSQANHFRENNRKYRGEEVAVHVGKQITPAAHIEAGVGANRVREVYGSGKKTETSYYVQGTLKPSDKVEVNVRHEHDIAYKNHSLINNAGDILTEDTTTAEVTVKPVPRVRINAKTQYSELSDDNIARKNKVGAYYAVLPEWPYAEVGVEANHIDYEKQDDGYWTPDNYRGVSLVGSTSFPVSKNVSLSASAAVTRSTSDDDDTYNTGYYASVGANFKLSEKATVSVNAHHIDSHQDSGDWSESALMTNFKYRF